MTQTLSPAWVSLRNSLIHYGITPVEVHDGTLVLRFNPKAATIKQSEVATLVVQALDNIDARNALGGIKSIRVEIVGS